MTCNKALGLCDAGWSFAEIGKHLGVTKGAVSRMVAREKVILTNKPDKPDKPDKPVRSMPGRIAAVVKNNRYPKKY